MAIYKRRKVKENPERQIVLGMIVSDRFLKSIQPILKQELVETPFINTVMNWCLSHYAKFETAPGIHIEDIYKKQVRLGTIEDAEDDLIVDLLSSLSDEYEDLEQFNEAYLLDKAEKYFEGKNLSKKVKDIKTFIAQEDIEGAQKELTSYKRVALPQSQGINPFIDRDSMQKAFEDAAEPLFKLPAAAGHFLNDLFVREGFVTILGPEKSGKTWMMIELAIAARKAGKNIAFFSVGDMSVPQMQLRFAIRFTGRSNRKRYCGELKVPCLDCKSNQDDSCDLPNRAGTFGIVKESKPGEPVKLMTYEEAPDHVPCTFCKRHHSLSRDYKPSSWMKIRPPVKPLEWTDAADAGERLNRRYGKKSKLLLSAWPSKTLSIAGMEHQLDMWEDEQEFVPDVVIVDYMDTMDLDCYQDQYRHQVNNLWADMRGIGQKRHCLVISASQSDADSRTAKYIGMSNFSEDKRKFSHVTGTITLNQLPEEKKMGVMRLGQIAVREGDFDEKQSVTILQSLAMGKPLLNSYW